MVDAGDDDQAEVGQHGRGDEEHLDSAVGLFAVRHIVESVAVIVFILAPVLTVTNILVGVEVVIFNVECKRDEHAEGGNERQAANDEQSDPLASSVATSGRQSCKHLLFCDGGQKHIYIQVRIRDGLIGENVHNFYWIEGFPYQ